MSSQKDRLLYLFRTNRHHLSLGEILATSLAAEYRARFTDLRRDGYRIECVRHPESPSKNLYVLHEKEEMVFEKTGQRLIV